MLNALWGHNMIRKFKLVCVEKDFILAQMVIAFQVSFHLFNAKKVNIIPLNKVALTVPLAVLNVKAQKNALLVQKLDIFQEEYNVSLCVEMVLFRLEKNVMMEI